MQLRVLGLDPSLSNLGMAKGILTLNADKKPCKLDITDLTLVSTSASAKTKKAVRKNSDDLLRCRKLYEGLQEAMADVDIVFIEMPVGSQTARAMMSYGACVMLAATINKPLFQVTPDEVKLASKIKRATKDQMIEWATKTFPAANWLMKGDTYIKKNEHLADALGAIVSGCKSEQFKEAASLFK